MIGDDEHLTVKDDEINDLSLNNNSNKINRRKQIKPNRVTTDDDIQQSQSEVYCNLCERSFCNKYFLKTHLAKKHAEINVTSPLSSTENNDQPLPLLTQPKTTEKSSEDYCEICQKHFCNKYYLRKHKGECHGVYTDYIKSLQKSSTENPVKTTAASRPISTNPLLLNPFYPGPSDIKSLFPIPTSPQRTIRRCHLCQIDFRNRALFRMHMNTFHPNEKIKKTSSTNTTYVPPFVDTSSQLAQKIATGQTSQAIVNDSYFSAKMADRVVCEICNKQVCNKYFLKTHKAKVHGITSSDNADSQLAENHDQTFCSICQKDFPSKYFYLFHMQTVHNDTSDPAYQTLLQMIQNSTTRNENSNPFDDHGDNLKRKRTSSQSSNLTEDTNAGLQPFLIESEDPKFSHTFVPCMVYLPVIRRVTQQVKINLRLKPVLAENSS